ncbi:MAG: response regulator transcription factor [Clostridia bacterium]|nr:response regulator transcription factor [Clostridia bacterium]
MNILLVDDEKDLTRALTAILTQHGYSVDCAFNGEDGLNYALSDIYDVIILDVMLPEKNGFEVLKELRARKIVTPVIMLTAKSDVSDKIEGLENGADDYLTKPFDSAELLARIKALTRRGTAQVGNIITFSDLILDKDTVELSVGEKRISLGKKELRVMEILMANAGKCVEKERLIEKIWGFDSDAEYNTIEVYVSFLRKKLAAIGSKTEIKSLRGIGYALTDKND